MAAVTCAVFALFAAAAFMLEPRYEARAVVEILQVNERPAVENYTPALANDVVTISTEANKIVSEQAVREVFRQFAADYERILTAGWPLARLKSTLRGWFARACPADPAGGGGLSDGACAVLRGPSSAERNEGAFLHFKESLSADVVRGTRLIEVNFVSADPTFSAEVANAVAARYLRQKEVEKNAYRNDFAGWLDERLGQLRKRVGSAEQAVAAYRGSTNLIELGKETDQARRSPVVEELAGIIAALSAAKADRANAESKLARLQRSRSSPQGIASAGEVVDSPLIRQLIAEEAGVRREIADLSSDLGEHHPRMISARAKDADLKKKINEEINKILAAAEQDYQAADATVRSLSAEVDALQSKAADEERQRVGLRELERAANTESEVYGFYLRLTQQVAGQQDWNPADVALVTSATVPLKRGFPSKGVMLPVGLIAGFLLSTLLASGLELRRRHRVYVDPRELEADTGLPVFGIVPWHKRAKPDTTGDFALAIEDMGMKLRWSARRGSGAVVVTVTSSVCDEGKSVVSLALARWFAAAGDRALLVDADLRRPTISQMACDDRAQKKGLSWAVRHPDPESLDLAILGPSDPSRPTPGLLMTLPTILEQERNAYDVIIIDTPPLLVMSDALMMMTASDHILFAVRWASSSRSSVEFALRLMDAEALSRTRLVFSMVERRGYRAYGAPGTEQYRSHPSQRYRALIPRHALQPVATGDKEARAS